MQISALFLLSAFVVAVYVSENAFEKVSHAAQRQAYQQAAALELSADAQCQPAGPGKCTGSNKPGKDQCPCKEAQSGSPGLCVAGKCKGFGNAGQTAGQANNSFLQGLGQGLAQGLMQMLSQMMQGGGGGSGGSSGYQTPIEVAQQPTVLDNAGSTPLTDIGTLSPVDLAFGTAGTTTTTDNGQTTQTATDNAGGSSGTDTAAGGAGEDSITTRYENKGDSTTTSGSGSAGSGSTNPDDASEFTDELKNSGLGDSGPAFGADDALNNSGLTQDQLELLALEAQARQGGQSGAQGGGSLNLPYGQLTPDEVRRLQTLGYSTVSGELNPLSGFGGDGAGAPAEQENQGVIASIVNFVKRIFGFGTPAVQQ
jgi:hypothetical protein